MGVFLAEVVAELLGEGLLQVARRARATTWPG